MCSDYIHDCQSTSDKCEDDWTEREDDKYRKIMSYHAEALKNLKFWEKEVEESKKMVIEEAAGKNCRGHGYKIEKIFVKGRVDYSLIPELENIDLEKYRKEGAAQWRISAVK